VYTGRMNSKTSRTGIFQKITKIYAEADIVTREQAPGLLLTLVIVLVALPILLLQDALTGELLNAAIEGATFAVLILALVLLFRGRCAAASTITTVVVIVGTAGLTLLFPDHGPNRLYQGYFYVLGPAILSVVFAGSWVATLVAVLLGLA